MLLILTWTVFNPAALLLKGLPGALLPPVYGTGVGACPLLTTDPLATSLGTWGPAAPQTEPTSHCGGHINRNIKIYLLFIGDSTDSITGSKSVGTNSCLCECSLLCSLLVMER